MRRRILLGLLIVVGSLVVVGAGLIHWFLRGDGVRQALEQQAAQWLGQPVRIGDADVRVLPRPAIELSAVNIGQPSTVTLATVHVSTGLRGLLSRRIEDAEIVISDSRLDLPLSAVPAGAAAPQARAEARPTTSAEPAETRSPLTVASIRTIRFDNVRLRSRGHEIVVSADASLAGSTLTLTRFTARSGTTALEASGTVALDPMIDANLTVTAGRLSLDALLALANAFSPSSSPAAKASSAGGAGTARVRTSLRAEQVDVAGAALTNFRAELNATGGQIAITPLTFALFGGEFSGRARADVGDATALALTADVGLRNLDVATLAAFGGAPGAITGRLSGKGAFSGRGADAAAALAAMRGDGAIDIQDGEITRLDLVRTVILFFGRPAADAPASAGSRFERIDATFSLASQVIRASALSLRSQDADLVGDGSLALTTKALEGRARLVLSESLSAQAGSDLARYTREGKRIVLPALIGGTLDQPRIRIDASQVIQRGLKNEVQRQFDRLFRRGSPPPP